MGKETTELKNIAKNSTDISSEVKRVPGLASGRKTFSKYLKEIYEKNFKNVGGERITKQWILDKKLNNMAHTTFFSYLGGSKLPKREHVIALAVAFKATVEETDELLRLAGHSPLDPKDKDEPFIINALERRLDPDDLEQLLIENGCTFSLWEKEKKKNE